MKGHIRKATVALAAASVLVSWAVQDPAQSPHLPTLLKHSR